MSDFAAPIAPAFGPILIRSKPRVQMRDLFALFKVRTTHAVLVTLLIDVQYWLQLVPALDPQPRLLVEVFLSMFAWNIGFWIIAFAIVAVVQTRMAAGRLRTIVLLISALVWPFLWYVWTRWGPVPTHIAVELGLVTSAGLDMHGFWLNTIYLLLAVWYYESADRAKLTTAALRASELSRRGAEMWLLELRLRSLQARLDPQVLFDTMDEAGRLYRSRPSAAEQLVDALIDYLRRALPQLRQPQSTLHREVALALAYMRVLRAADGESVAMESEVEPKAGDARFPPMVVQPLCDALARSALASGEPVRIRISAAREQDCARLCLTAQPVQTAPSEERLAEIRHTLLAMFGPVARMNATGATGSVVRVVVEVPYDAAPRTDS